MEFLAGPEAASESNGTTDESRDNGTMKTEEPAIKQGEDGAAKDGVVSEESANKQGDDTAAKDGAVSTAPKVDDENKTAVKEETEDGSTSVTSPPQAMDIFTTTHYIGLELAKNAKSLDLSYQVDEFKTLCTSWQKYEEELKDVASIGVQHCRNFNLPDDVFEPGETKPQKKSTKSASNGRKREATEESNQKPPPAKRQQSSVAAAG